MKPAHGSEKRDGIVARRLLGGLPAPFPVKRSWSGRPPNKHNNEPLMKFQSNRIHHLAAIAVVGSGCCSVALAGDPVAPAPAMTPAVEDSVVSGTLSLDYNTHFISYGWDVWASGENFGGSATFNPSLGLTWQLTDALSYNLGTWWDVNDNIPSSIGGDIQEIDVFTGLAYDFGLVTLSGTYQAWIYGSDTEHVFDVGFAFDTFLSPSLTIHHRFDEGASGGETGTVLVGGVKYDFELGPVSFGVPLNVGFFLEDDFHPGSTDEGVGFGSLGLTATYPLGFISDRFGEWNIHGGLTYYITDDGVIGNPKDDDFLTGSIGIGVAF